MIQIPFLSYKGYSQKPLFKMASPQATKANSMESPPSEQARRGSLIVDTNLASEEDAAVLAKMGYDTNLASCLLAIQLTQETKIQTGTSKELQYD